MSKANDLELVDVVNALRQQLGKLNQQRQRQTQDVSFEVKDIELEISAKVTREKGVSGSADIKFWVVDAKVGGDGAKTSEQFQRIKLSLKPKTQKGSALEVSGEVEFK